MEAVFTSNTALPFKLAKGKFSPSMLVKLKSWADCVVEAAKIIGAPPNRLANTERNKNMKRVSLFMRA